MNSRGTRTRPLGTTRASLSTLDELRLPPLTRAPEEAQRRELSDGLQGAAMQMPPPKPTNSARGGGQLPDAVIKKRMTPRVTPSKRPKSDHSSSGKSEDSGEERKSAATNQAPKQAADDRRIQELLKRVAQLEKILSEQEVEIKRRDEGLRELEERLQQQSLLHEKALEKERKHREEAELHFRHARDKCAALEARQAEAQQQHEEQLRLAEEQHEMSLAELRQEKDKQVAERDERLKRLKSQMADALKGNSQERQHQLDELTKELNRLQDECDSLRMKLKAATLKAKGQQQRTK